MKLKLWYSQLFWWEIGKPGTFLFVTFFLFLEFGLDLGNHHEPSTFQSLWRGVGARGKRFPISDEPSLCKISANYLGQCNKGWEWHIKSEWRTIPEKDEILHLPGFLLKPCIACIFLERSNIGHVHYHFGVQKLPSTWRNVDMISFEAFLWLLVQQQNLTLSKSLLQWGRVYSNLPLFTHKFSCQWRRTISTANGKHKSHPSLMYL